MSQGNRNHGRWVCHRARWGALLWLGAALLGGLAAAQGAAATSPPSSGGAAGPAAALFEKQCYSCHNIGGGKKKGPDLMGLEDRRTRDWIHRFVLTPKALKNTGDPTAVKLFAEFAPEEMPDQVLSPDQIDQILALIAELTKTRKSFVPQSERLSRQPTARDVYPGYQLFAGRAKLSAGAPACISCHSVADCGPLEGGTLGPDLTQANVKYTDIELASILKTPAFPVMSKVFQNRALTDEEAIRLLAYLQRARTRTPDPPRASLRYLGGGLGGVLAALGLMGFVWRGRLRGVRKPMIAQSRRRRRDDRTTG